jgi:hypothetical protein
VKAKGPPRATRVRMSVGVEGRPTIRVPLPIFSRGVEVQIRSNLVENGPDASIAVSAVDQKVQGLVAALGDMSAEEALLVLDWASGGQDLATSVLFHKVQDPWAAAASALVLIRSGDLGDVASWITNLARLAPHIADASIAAAWAELATSSDDVGQAESSALEHLTRARRIGAPAFVVASSLATDMLASLRLTAQAPVVRRRASEEYTRAVARSRFRLFRTPFMIWEQPGEKLQGGRLPGLHYMSLARGSVGAGGFSLTRVLE